MGWLSILRGAAKPLASIPEDLAKGLRKPTSGVKAFDEAFGNLHFEIKNKIVHANDVPLHTVETLLRRGELVEAFAKLKKSNVITAADEVKYRQLIDTPDLAVRNLEQNVKRSRLMNEDLDIVPTSGADLEAKLTPTAKSKLNTVFDTIKKGTITGATVTGLIAAIVITDNFFESIAAATKSRNGVYILTSLNGKVVSAKVSSRSCGDPSVPEGVPASTDSLPLSNPAIYLLYLAFHDNESVRAEQSKIKKLVGVNITKSNVRSIIDDPVKFSNVYEYYYSSNYTGPKNFKLCNAEMLSLMGKDPHECIAWNTSANVNDVEYYNAYDLPSNKSIVCVQNSTVLDTLVDVLGDNVNKLIGSNFSQKIGGILKYVGMALAIVCSIVFAVFMYFHLKKGGSGGGDSDTINIYEGGGIEVVDDDDDGYLENDSPESESMES